MEMRNHWWSVTETKNGLIKLLWRRAICVCRWNETTFLLEFSRERCRVLPLGRRTLAGSSSAAEALGVLVSSKLSVSQPWQQRCQQLLGCLERIRISGLKRSSTSKQHWLDHTASSFGLPERVIHNLQQIQQKIVNMVMGMKPWEKRLRDLGFFRPHKRQFQGTGQQPACTYKEEKTEAGSLQWCLIGGW